MTLNEQKRLTWYLWCLIWLALIFGVILFFFLQLNIISLPEFVKECFFRKHFSVYCPSCGGTRACKMLCEGKLIQSFLYHPAVPLGAIWLFWFQLSNLIEYLSHGRRKIGMVFHFKWLIYLGILFLINFILKNF